MFSRACYDSRCYDIVPGGFMNNKQLIDSIEFAGKQARRNMFSFIFKILGTTITWTALVVLVIAIYFN